MSNISALTLRKPCRRRPGKIILLFKEAISISSLSSETFSNNHSTPDRWAYLNDSSIPLFPPPLDLSYPMHQQQHFLPANNHPITTPPTTIHKSRFQNLLLIYFLLLYFLVLFFFFSSLVFLFVPVLSLFHSVFFYPYPSLLYLLLSSLFSILVSLLSFFQIFLSLYLIFSLSNSQSPTPQNLLSLLLFHLFIRSIVRNNSQQYIPMYL